jgi:rubrerythrin
LFGKNPIDLPQGRKLARDEVADALRQAIIAELDAITFYLQLARAIEDERIRRVFEDIAREEKTHVGEFLAVLKTIDKEQVEELEKGAREVEELTGLKTNALQTERRDVGGAGSVEEVVKNTVKKIVLENRRVIDKLPVTSLGRGVDAVPVEIIKEGKLERAVLPLLEFSEKFSISQRAIDTYTSSRGVLEIPEAHRAGYSLAVREEEYVIEVIKNNSLKMKRTDWSQPGQSVEDVAKAVVEITRRGGVKPIVLVVNPVDYAKLLVVDGRTGVMDLERLKQLVDAIVYTHSLREGESIVLSSTSNTLDIVYGANAEVDYIGPENGYHVYRVWSTLAVRIRTPDRVVVLSKE